LPVILIILARNTQRNFFIFIHVRLGVTRDSSFLFLFVTMSLCARIKAFGVPTFKSPYKSMVCGLFELSPRFCVRGLLPCATFSWLGLCTWVTPVTKCATLPSSNIHFYQKKQSRMFFIQIKT